MLTIVQEIGPPTANLPKFDVAAIRPVDPKAGMVIGILAQPGGRVSISLYTLRMLIEEAFSVHSFQIVAGPAWLDDDRYNIQARSSAPSVSLTRSRESLSDEQRRMLQSLLVERFQLKFHRKTKEGLVYLLIRGRKEPKLQITKSEEAFPRIAGLLGGSGVIRGTNVPMSLLAARLSGSLEHVVLDKTGLSGSFDFRIEFPSDDPHADLTSVAVAAVNELGLRLQSTRGPVETIIIDYAGKPSPN